ncbi:MAG: hypothetical protein COB26_11715 [Piscirickettsiaceae bacterium]|nr:MAG: hypothetical protein COB89_05940 [Piscirickettsiaceae bacterium]PCI66145.1 MAG: hypothetical protein COB26_11715 [Piscirickettsiaceae bacterium]
MKMQSLLLSILLSIFCLTANAQTKDEAKRAIDHAQILWDQTIIAGHEWNTIKPLVAQAKQALKSNDFTKALALATQASVQSKHALVQAEHEKTNWVKNLPK